MSTKNYSFDEAPVNITQPDGEKLAIFDVSETVHCRWVAISDKTWKALTTFGGTDEMMEFVAKAQDQGATIQDDGLLADLASGIGFDTWAEYVADECGKSVDSEVEFPVYYDAQGNEHAEF